MHVLQGLPPTAHGLHPSEDYSFAKNILKFLDEPQSSSGLYLQDKVWSDSEALKYLQEENQELIMSLDTASTKPFINSHSTAIEGRFSSKLSTSSHPALQHIQTSTPSFALKNSAPFLWHESAAEDCKEGASRPWGIGNMQLYKDNTFHNVPDELISFDSGGNNAISAFPSFKSDCEDDFRITNLNNLNIPSENHELEKAFSFAFPFTSDALNTSEETLLNPDIYNARCINNLNLLQDLAKTTVAMLQVQKITASPPPSFSCAVPYSGALCDAPPPLDSKQDKDNFYFDPLQQFACRRSLAFQNNAEALSVLFESFSNATAQAATHNTRRVVEPNTGWRACVSKKSPGAQQQQNNNLHHHNHYHQHQQSHRYRHRVPIPPPPVKPIRLQQQRFLPTPINNTNLANSIPFPTSSPSSNTTSQQTDQQHCFSVLNTVTNLTQRQQIHTKTNLTNSVTAPPRKKGIPSTTAHASTNLASLRKPGLNMAKPSDAKIAVNNNNNAKSIPKSPSTLSSTPKRASPVDLIISVPIVIPYGTICVTKTSGKNFYYFDETQQRNEAAALYFSPSSGVSDTWASFLQIRLGRIGRVPVQHVRDVIALFQAVMRGDANTTVWNQFLPWQDTTESSNNSVGTTGQLNSVIKSISSQHSSIINYDGLLNLAADRPIVGKTGTAASKIRIPDQMQHSDTVVEVCCKSSEPLKFEKPIRFNCCGIEYAKGTHGVESTTRKRYETRAWLQSEQDAVSFKHLCLRLHAFERHLEKLAQVYAEQQLTNDNNNPNNNVNTNNNSNINNNSIAPICQCYFISEVDNDHLAKKNGLPIVVREYGEIQNEELLASLTHAKLTATAAAAAAGKKTCRISTEVNRKFCAEGIEVTEVDPRFTPDMVLTRLVAGNEHPSTPAEMLSAIHHLRSGIRLPANDLTYCTDKYFLDNSTTYRPLVRTHAVPMQPSIVGRYVFSENQHLPAVQVQYEDTADCFSSKHGFIYQWYKLQSNLGFI